MYIASQVSLLLNLRNFLSRKYYSSIGECGPARIVMGPQGGSKWWTKDTVAVVTGSNMGIGLAVVRLLAKEGLTVVLTARTEFKGQAALHKIKGEDLDSVVYHQLDITNSESIDHFADWIRTEFGGFDILINNAGLGLSPSTPLGYETANYIFGTNYFGTTKVTYKLLPLLRVSPHGSRIFTVGGRAGLLQNVSEDLRQSLSDAQHLSEPDINAIANKYLESLRSASLDVGALADNIQKGTKVVRDWAIQQEQGLSPEVPIMNLPHYSESKAILATWVRVHSKFLHDNPPDGHQIYSNLYCPGVVVTHMNPSDVGQTPEQGARNLVHLALLPGGENYPSGKYFVSERGDEGISY